MTIRNHIVHDIDRDGWGSAALMLAQLGAERCKLYPTLGKDGLKELAEVDAQPGDHIWVLDVPTPKSWKGAPRTEGVYVTWVDHHPVRFTDQPPDHIRLKLQRSKKRVTTMHLLVQHGQVPKLNKPMEFVRSMCVPDFETRWTRAIDGLSEAWLGDPVEPEELPEALAQAVIDGPMHPGLARLEANVEKLWAHVDRILNASEVKMRGEIVVVRLASAEGIKLKYFNMRAQRRYVRPVSILVHRNSRIYCGLASQGAPKFDILAHFTARNLEAKGLPYVAYVSIKKASIEQELRVLIAALEVRRP